MAVKQLELWAGETDFRALMTKSGWRVETSVDTQGMEHVRLVKRPPEGTEGQVGEGVKDPREGTDKIPTP